MACTPGSNPFTRIRLSVDQRGETVVEWDLTPRMSDCGPYRFYLQFARAAEEEDSQWETINEGNPVTDVFSMIIDSTVRRHAMTNRSVYRVKLVTPRATYYSNPEYTFGILSNKKWKLAQEIIRKESIDKDPEFGGTSGYLIHRRVFGPRCEYCTNPNTHQVVNTHCEYCYGTGILGGYFAPVYYPVKFLSPESYDVQISNVGSVDPHEIEARMLPFPFPSNKDVWYEGDTGRAFIISDIKVVSKLQSFPLALVAKLSLAPATDPVYFLIN